MSRKNAAKLYVILTGTQLILDSFASSLSQHLGFYDRSRAEAFEDPEFVLYMRRQILQARAALDLAERYLNKSCGTRPKAKKPNLDKLIFPPRKIKDIEGCRDWPEDGSGTDDPNYPPVSDEEE